MANESTVGTGDESSYTDTHTTLWQSAADDVDTRDGVGAFGGTTEIGWELTCQGICESADSSSSARAASRTIGSHQASTTSTNDLSGSGDLGSSRSGCGQVWARRNHYTVLGFLAWRWYHSKYWCWSGRKVTYVSTTAHPQDMAGTFYYRGLVGSQNTYYNYWSAISRSGHYSFRQAAIENCVLKYGCISVRYPWVKLWARADGSWKWQTGS